MRSKCAVLRRRRGMNLVEDGIVHLWPLEALKYCLKAVITTKDQLPKNTLLFAVGTPSFARYEASNRSFRPPLQTAGRKDGEKKNLCGHTRPRDGAKFKRLSWSCMFVMYYRYYH